MTPLELLRLKLDQLLTASLRAYLDGNQTRAALIEAEIRRLTGIEAQLLRARN